MNPRFESYVNTLTPSKQLLAREAVREYLAGEADEIECLRSADEVYKKSRWLADKETEHFVAYYMKNNHRIIKQSIIAQGGLAATIVDVRVLLREALLCGATCMICVHNHPSGSLCPSSDDDNLTKTINKACNAIQLKLLDHVIVTNQHYYSYCEHGRL